MQTEEFLNLYRQLEQALNDYYENKPRHFSSSIMEFLHDDMSIDYRDRLDLCREVRNLLSHHALIEHESLVSPSKHLIDTLKEILTFLKQPPLAITYATPFSKMMIASLDTPILELMSQMKKRGFSHIPVLHRQQFYGVFSRTTPFHYLLQHQQFPLDATKTLSILKKELALDTHEQNRYHFISQQTTLYEAKTIFIKYRRTAALFISEDGTPQTPLLAMLTPVDIL